MIALAFQCLDVSVCSPVKDVVYGALSLALFTSTWGDVRRLDHNQYDTQYIYVLLPIGH